MAHGGKRDKATREPVSKKAKPGEDERQKSLKKAKAATTEDADTVTEKKKAKKAAAALIRNAEYRDVSIDLIEENTWNPNRMQAGMYEKLRKAIKLQGFTVPIVVRDGNEKGKFKNGRLEIIDGAHRFRIMREEGAQTIPVASVGCVSDVMAKAATIQFNKIRGEHDRDLEGQIFADILAAGDDADVIIDAMPFSLEEMESQASLANEEIGETDVTTTDEDDDEPASEPMWDVVSFFGLDKVSRKRADKIILNAGKLEKKLQGKFSDDVGGSLLLTILKELNNTDAA